MIYELIAKVNKELKEFESGLLKLEKKEILSSCFDLVMIREFVYEIESKVDDLVDDEIAYLLNKGNLLDYLLDELYSLDNNRIIPETFLFDVLYMDGVSGVFQSNRSYHIG